MKIQFAVLAAAIIYSPAMAADPAAASLLRQAMAAQGGEQLLRQVRTVAFEASGYRNMLEQSERPEGPYLVEFHEASELHDHERSALRRQLQVRVPPSQSYAVTTVVAKDVAMIERGGTQAPGRARDARLAAESLALSPERVLVTALDAPDLRRGKDTTLHGVPHQVVEFSVDGAPARLYLSQYTHLPSALEYSGALARNGYAAYLGDVVQRTLWSFWRLDRSGLRFPMQWDVRLNDLPDRTFMLRSLKVNAPYDAKLVEVPAAVASRFDPAAPAPDPSQMPLGQRQTEIAAGVVLVEGAWNTTIIDQGDGLVVLEAPISSDYSAKVLAEAARRYPGKPVKAVISTSDSWPHLAGLREYAARGIPIYALALSEPVVRRTLGASHRQHPDSLQKAPRKPVLRLVDAKVTIGAGDNRIELYPIRGAASERQMMAYLPGRRLLYGSDPFQKTQSGAYFMPQPVTELVQAVQREQLQVDRFFMMHMPPTPYAELLDVTGGED